MNKHLKMQASLQAVSVSKEADIMRCDKQFEVAEADC